MRRALVALAALALVCAGPAQAGKHRHRARRAHTHLAAAKGVGVAHVPARATPPAPGWGAPVAPADWEPSPAASPPDAGGPPPASPASCPTAVGVSEGEYYTALSRTTVCTGAVTVQLRDVGQDPHDLRIVREDGPSDPVQYDTIAPGTSSTRTLTLAAGTYYLYCTLADGGGSHEAQGMHALLAVTG